MDAFDAGDLLYTDHPFMGGFVGEPGRADNIANGIEAFDARLEPFIDDDMAAIGFRADIFKAETFRIAHNADREDDALVAPPG